MYDQVVLSFLYHARALYQQNDAFFGVQVSGKGKRMSTTEKNKRQKIGNIYLYLYIQ